MLKDLEHHFGRLARVGDLDHTRVVMDDSKFRSLGIIVNILSFHRKEGWRKDSFLPDFSNAFIKFRLGLDSSDHAHFVVHDLAERRFGLEAVAKPVIVEEPTRADQLLRRFVN